MKLINDDITPLKEHEIAGPQTINPLQKYVLGMHSLSEFLTLNPDGRGSVSFDLNFEALATSIIGLLGESGGINFDFRCTINDGTLYVSSGKVYLPFDVASISAYTHSLASGDSGKMIYARLTSKTSGEIVLSSGVTHTLQASNYRLTLPIATITYTDGEWGITYHHLGAFALEEEPYFWISNYNKNENQHLVHDAGADGTKWAKIEDSSSSSDSSSSDSSSSSSSSDSSSSASGGFLRIVYTGEQPTGAEGDYYPNGDPHSLNTTWTCSNGNFMIYETHGWDFWAWWVYYDSAETGERTVTECSRAADYDPTEWTQAHPATGDNVFFEAYYISE